MTIAATVMNALARRQIPYELIEHARSYTSPGAALAAHVPDDHIAKGVLMRDASGYLLVVIPGDRWVDRRRLRAELGRDLLLASEEEIGRWFYDCDLGAIPPLGAAYDLEMVVDEDLTTLARIYLEGGDHHHLIALEHDRFMELMRGVRHGHFTEIH